MMMWYRDWCWRNQLFSGWLIEAAKLENFNIQKVILKLNFNSFLNHFLFLLGFIVHFEKSSGEPKFFLK